MRADEWQNAENRHSAPAEIPDVIPMFFQRIFALEIVGLEPVRQFFNENTLIGIIGFYYEKRSVILSRHAGADRRSAPDRAPSARSDRANVRPTGALRFTFRPIASVGRLAERLPGDRLDGCDRRATRQDGG
jgi:hypothetical protein